MSNLHFNLLDEPWLPCVMPDGSTRVYGIRTALAEAHHIREISDPSPLVTASLHRVLLAVVHAVLRGPKDSVTWEMLRNRGAWDMAAFDQYFATWHSRFDLFDEEYPFYQWPGLDFVAEVPIAKLTHELASGNNATLFDHTTEQGGSSLDPGTAARYLIAQQNYAVGGLVSFAKGEDPARYKSAAAAPLTRGAMILVKGINLFQTLLLNLCRYDGKVQPFAVVKDHEDKPAWEREPPAEIDERRPDGYLDLLTWQSRRIRLHARESPDGTVFTHVVIMKGNTQAVPMKSDQAPSRFLRYKAEQMQAFRKVEKPAAGQDPWQPIGFREDRALWRDSLAFMQSAADGSERPGMLSWLDELAENAIIDQGERILVDLYGMNTDKAKVLFWRHERLTLPLIYLDEASRDLRATLATEIDKAEDVGKALQWATRELAKLLLSPDVDIGGRNPAGEDQGRLAQRLSEGRTYWSRLGAPFSAFVTDLPDAEASKSEGETSLPVERWREELRQAAYGAFHTMVGGLDTSGRNLKAVAISNRIFAWRMREIVGPGEVRTGGGTST